MSGRNDSLKHLVRWMCSGPARLAGLEKHKGAIASGYDADIVVWNPEKRFIVRPKMLQHRHKLTPYAKQSLRGVVEATFLRGEMIYDRGRFLGTPRGALLAARRTLMDFTEYIDLAAERLGGRVLAANDEFFAPKENLLKAAAPVWIADKYTDVGKWMDGWETRRRRTPGYDWCIVKLGLPGIVHGVVVDTAYFKGNYPEHCEIEACAIDGDPSVAQLEDPATKWIHPASEIASCRRHSKSVSDLASGPSHAPAIQNLSGRRRGAPARPRRSDAGLAGARPAQAARSTSPPSSTAAGSSFRATCFSARAIT